MSIINEDYLKADCVEVMINNFEMKRSDAVKIITEDIVKKAVEEMYRAQESMLEDLYLKSIKKDGKENDTARE